MRGVPNPRVVTELGTERWCPGCGEFWPEDEEFWFIDTRGGGRPRVYGRCRACWSERVRDEHGRRVFRPMIAMEAV